MERLASKTLVLPFQRQNFAYPTAKNRWLFLNAHPLEHSQPWENMLVCEQSFRPVFRDLESSGYDVQPYVQADTKFSGALVLTTRFTDLNKQLVARAVTSVVPGGPVLVAGEKTSGIASLRKWVASNVPIVDSFSKFHAQIVVINAQTALEFEQMLPEFDKKAGIFGKGKLDSGSALLASTFDAKMKGDVADFCAGTGFLAQQLLERAAPQKIDLFEAEHRALDIAKTNLEGCSLPTSFFWLDLAGEPVRERYDWIVMNPPFHAGRAAEPVIGQNMIRAARKALRPGGKLRLVANRNLPYENTLKEVFGGFRELVVQDGFKVLQA